LGTFWAKFSQSESKSHTKKCFKRTLFEAFLNSDNLEQEIEVKIWFTVT